MKRGDLLTVALQGDLGRPLPALVIQSDLFDDHPSVTVLPVTSTLQEAPLFRISIKPNESNGAAAFAGDGGQGAVRAVLAARPNNGWLNDETLLAVNRALAVFLVLA